MKKIEQEFMSRGIKRGGILFLRPRDALDMVAQAESRGHPILGFDAFTLTPASTKPWMEHSRDLSNFPASESWNKTRVHLQKYLDSDFWFEIVVSEVRI